jgi:hypothetical protein
VLRNREKVSSDAEIFILQNADQQGFEKRFINDHIGKLIILSLVHVECFEIAVSWKKHDFV